MRTLAEIVARRAVVIDALGVLWDKKKNEGYILTDEELAEIDTLLAESEVLDDDERKAKAAEARAAFLNAARPALHRTEPRRTMPHTDRGNTRGETHQFSVLKFLRQINPAEKGEYLDGLELETSQELRAKAIADGKMPTGHLLPMDLPVNLAAARRGAAAAGRPETRAIFNVSAGAGTIETLLELPLIDILRNRMLWLNLGATMLTGIVGELVLPKQSAAGSVTWNGETATNATEGAVDVDGIALTPKRASGFQPYSKTLLRQSSIDVENFIRADLALCHAIALDAAAFNGSGSAPAGALGNSAIPTVAIGTNGGAMTWAKLLEMEQVLDVANAMDAPISYVTTPKGRSALKGITKVSASTFGDFLWDRENLVNSYPAYSTNQLPSNLTKGSGTNLSASLLGDFSQGFFALWGDGLDIVVDPFTLAVSGQVKVVIEQYADFANRRPESFAKCLDRTTV